MRRRIGTIEARRLCYADEFGDEPTIMRVTLEAEMSIKCWKLGKIYKMVIKILILKIFH